MLTMCNSAGKLTENISIKKKNPNIANERFALVFSKTGSEVGWGVGSSHRYGVLEVESQLKSVSAAASL